MTSMRKLIARLLYRAAVRIDPMHGISVRITGVSTGGKFYDKYYGTFN